MENKLHIELLAKACDLTPDEIQVDLIKPEYETPFQVISVHSALSALQALETALTEKHRAEVVKKDARIKELEEELDFKLITRVEVVNHHSEAKQKGSVFYYHNFKMKPFISIQDERRTLKIFIEDSI